MASSATNVHSEKDLGIGDGFRKTAHFTWCVGGLLTCLITYGLLHEKILKEPYMTPEGISERFQSSFFIVCANRAMAMVVSIIAIFVTEGPAGIAPKAPVHYFGASALVSTISTVCQHDALKYLSFAGQTMGKSLKIVATMLAVTAILGVRYTPIEYLRGLVIGVACVAFLALGGGARSKGRGAAGESNLLVGGAYMVGYLCFDALVPTVQKAVFRDRKVSAANQSLYFSAFALLISSLGLWYQSELSSSLSFLRRHPTAAVAMAGFSLVSAVQQQFVMLTVKHYGPVVFSIAMTTRQMLSIILSSIVYKHYLTTHQRLAAAAVFAALYSEAWGKAAKGGSKKKDGAAVDKKDA